MQGQAALITGGSAGIGANLAAQLARNGACVTLADVDLAGAEATAARIRSAGGQAIAVRCDVADPAQHLAAFQAHMQRWGRLDYALLNAGIAERGDLITGSSDRWQQTLDVDLKAVLEGVRLAARSMLTGSPDTPPSRPPSPGSGKEGQPPEQWKGVIMVTASAGGTFPMPFSPVYAAAKAGCISATRSLAGPLARRGIRICALCPQFTDTAMVRGMQQADAAIAAETMWETGGRLLTVDQVAQAGLHLLTDSSKVGTALVVLVDGSWVEPQRTRFKSMEMPAAAVSAQVDPALVAWATGGTPGGALPPASTRVIEVHRLSTDFRAATHIVQRPLPAALPPGTVLIRRAYVGINASDVNYSAGRYFGSTQAAQAKLPFPAGFEAVGVVAAAAPDVQGLAVGQPVATMTYGGFADWAVVAAKHAFAVPAVAPEMVALMTSGLTASIALEQAGLRKGQTVLVTAAAGGTGQLAVQLAVLAGCTVIGTCSGGDKADLLRSLGCHRVVNYRQESLKAVLKREFPRGLDLVYESVGGDMFDVAVDALAPRGRLIIIGMMSAYADGWVKRQYPGIAEKLLWKSVTLQGFFLLHYASEWRRHLKKLAGLLQGGRLRVQMDPRRLEGLESVADAVEHLQSGRSVGKVYVQLAQPPAGAAAGGAAPRARL